MNYKKVKCHECNGTGLTIRRHTFDAEFFGVMTSDGYVRYHCKQCDGKGYFVVKLAGTGY